MQTAQDRDELTTLMDPLQLAESSRHRAPLSDLALELAMQATSFRSSLPIVIHAALGDLVRSMNCYYSNLIEGHHTHPVDIERALHNDYSLNPEKRNLQLEAKAHIGVQQWIDKGGLQGRSVTAAGIREIHQRFCEQLPDELLWMRNTAGGQTLKVVSGELRQQDVKVGQHVAISAGAIPRFLERFERVYGGLGKAEKLLAIAAAHHRLLWIHRYFELIQT